MSIRFVIGRSGAGKTHWCLAGVRRALGEGAEGAGLVVLVPEQATFQIEQALAAAGGYHRARVVSFTTLARQVQSLTAAAGPEVLSETARQMLLRRVVQDSYGELKIFGATAGRSGFIARLSGMLREMRQYEKTPEGLLEEARGLAEGKNEGDKLLADKLHDLAVLYAGYQRAVVGRFIDPDDLPDQLAARCGELDYIVGAKLWVDGFAGFTPQQYTVLKALMTAAEDTAITLCIDPAGPGFKRAWSGEMVSDDEFFYPTLDTLARLVRLLRSMGQTAEPPVILPENGQAMPRFASEELACLETKWLGRPAQDLSVSQASCLRMSDGKGVLSRDFGEMKGPSASNKSWPGRPSHLPVRIIEAASRREELNAAAREILRLVREEGYRFRDIAVIFRDLSAYSELLEAVFDEHGIAYFLDQRRRLHRHPLLVLVHSVLKMAAEGFATEDVLAYLKTDFAGLTRTQVDILETVALAHGADYTHWTQDEPWRWGEPGAETTAVQVDAWRRQAAAPVMAFLEKVHLPSSQCGQDARVTGGPRQATVAVITTALFETLEQLNIAAVLSEWRAAALAAGDPEQAQIHVEAHRQLLRIFDELAVTLGDTSVTLDEYMEIITAALEELSLGLVPPVSDQVLVGAIERSRHPAIRAALVVGAVEKEFPQVSSIDPLLSDGQRQRLDRAGFELAPGRTRRLLQERYLGYIALTRASERLWVSYPRSDERGRELVRSSLVDELLRVWPDIKVESQDELNVWDTIATPGQLGRTLAGALSGLRYDQPVGDLWLSLTQHVLNGSQYEFYARHLAGLLHPRPATLAPDVAEAFFQKHTTTSASRLESFAACPFQHFARHMLNLTSREEFELAAVDFGIYYHRGLCAVFTGLQHAGQNWASAETETLERLVDEFRARYEQVDGPAGALFASSGRNRRLLAGAARRLLMFCGHLRERARVSRFEQIWAEARFGDRAGPDGQAEVFEMLKLGDVAGREFWLEGMIDRVDICRDGGRTGVAIYDYKMSGRLFSWSKIYHGLELQLPLYLAVTMAQRKLWGSAKVDPAGTFYLGILGKGQTQAGQLPPIWPAMEIEPLRGHKAQGVFDSGWLKQLDESLTPGTWSSFFTVYVKADGSMQSSRTKGLLDAAQMHAVMEHSRSMACRGVEKMLQGDIAVAPYRLEDESPCTYCQMQGVCRFDPEIGGYRFLAPLAQTQALEQLR